MRDLWIALLLGAIVVTKALDLLADRRLQLPSEHLMQEGVLLVLSAAGCFYLVGDLRRRTRERRQLAQTLSLSDARLAALGDELRRARSAYARTIRNQFEDWGLTVSEQEVAMLLLKGLSLREIALLRDTREKTVRQHASRVYAKAGLEGRHALAAWFLEDFMIATDDGSGAVDQAASPSRPTT